MNIQLDETDLIYFFPYLLKKFLFCIGAELINNVVLVSGV